jgi:hypothetical protein
MQHECFADEVAIDFPSVGRAVERMRVSFHGDHADADVSDAPAPVQTEVCLSNEDASRGLVIRLDVPVRGLCEACGGRGEVWAEPCGRCEGSGTSLVLHAVRVPVRPGVADGALIRFRLASPLAGSVRVEVRVVVRPAAV